MRPINLSDGTEAVLPFIFDNVNTTRSCARQLSRGAKVCDGAGKHRCFPSADE